MKGNVFEFVAARFSPKTRQASFTYAIYGTKTLRFKETLNFPAGKLQKIPPTLLKEFLKNLHLALGISYYKLYCPGTIKTPYALNEWESGFWHDLYERGLGEFFYRNQIDYRGLIHFPFNKKAKEFVPVSLPTKESALLGIGGGKDSIVAGEFLKQRKLPLTGFVLETGKPSPVVKDVSKAMGLKLLTVQRALDPQLFKPLPGSFNGHIPISSIFAFVGLFTAALYGHRYVVVANEASSSIGNLNYLGQEINHQWSKSIDFERRFQTHVWLSLTRDITYFSAIRHLYEIRVVEEFVKHPKYFKLFTSCNRSFRVDKERPKTLWCGECAKCAFVFAELAAFLKPDELLAIFGKNLFEDEVLLAMYKDLTGLGKMKPFDCVGTFEESRAALRRASKSWGKTPVLKTLLPLLEQRFKKDEDDTLFKVQDAPSLPAHFKFLGLKNVLLLGYGKEGRVTEKYLKKFYPALPLRIADESLDPHYLDAQNEADFAVKTPGLPKEKVTIPYTTATQIFFAENRNFKFGVTGSKGKSTTASLLVHILKTAEKPVELLGNIGRPMLEVLLKKPDPKTAYVLELSSYQLDELRQSPNVAVITNLFPEHMNYHGNIDNYYDAKLNLIRFLGNDGIFACNTAHPLLKKWGKMGMKTVPFSKWVPAKTNLLGEHNRSNAAAAIAAATAVHTIPKATLSKAVASFQPLRHRLQKVGTFRGITFYDDAISTSPESTIEAIKALTPLAPIGTLYLGGEDRGYDFTELEKVLRKNKIKNLVLFPDTGSRILKSRKGFNVFEANSLKEAVGLGYKHTPKGTLCVLSTASPHTFHMSFEDRGDEFQRLIRKAG